MFVHACVGVLQSAEALQTEASLLKASVSQLESQFSEKEKSLASSQQDLASLQVKSKGAFVKVRKLEILCVIIMCCHHVFEGDCYI